VATFGTLSSTFNFLQMVWQGSTGADMLRDVLDAIPDAMTRIDYSGTGTPVLNVIRRNDAAATTLALGTDGDLTGAPINLKARLELRPAYVEVQGMLLNADGSITPVKDTAGNAGAGVLGKQYVAVSGPGTRSWNNQAAALEKVSLATMPIDSSASSMGPLVYANTPELYALALAFGNSYMFMSSQTSWSTGSVMYGGWLASNWIDPYIAYWVDNVPISSYDQISGWYAINPLVGDTIPAWWEETGYERRHVRITVRFSAAFAGNYSQELFQKCLSMADITVYPSVGTSWFFRDFTIEFDAINLNCPTLTGIVRPCDRFLVYPVSGLAANLYAAQNFTSYDGNVTLLPGSVIPLPGNCVNITGGLAAWSTMKTLVHSADINLENGSANMTLGFSPRMTANALLDKFQRATSARIINL